MQKNLKIKYYLISTIILFFIIYSFEEKLPIEITPVENISLTHINQVINTSAYLNEQVIINNHSFLTFKSKNKKIKGILFNTNTTLEKKEYEIIGKITPYKNKAQITIYELKLLHQ